MLGFTWRFPARHGGTPLSLDDLWCHENGWGKPYFWKPPDMDRDKHGECWDPKNFFIVLNDGNDGNWTWAIPTLNSGDISGMVTPSPWFFPRIYRHRRSTLNMKGTWVMMNLRVRGAVLSRHIVIISQKCNNIPIWSYLSLISKIILSLSSGLCNPGFRFFKKFRFSQTKYPAGWWLTMGYPISFTGEKHHFSHEWPKIGVSYLPFLDKALNFTYTFFSHLITKILPHEKSPLYLFWYNIDNRCIGYNEELWFVHTLYYAILFCILQYDTILRCIVLYCIALHCIVLYCIVLYCTYVRR